MSHTDLPIDPAYVSLDVSLSEQSSVKAHKERLNRVSQGDIVRDVEHVEEVRESEGIITVARIIFPFAVVLTQDCDLAQDPRCAETAGDLQASGETRPASEDKWLLSVLVAPMYNAIHFFEGTHLADLSMRMQKFNSDQKRKVKINEVPRYHHMEFTDETPIPPVVIDFKHYFSVNAEYLKRLTKDRLVCQIPPLFREDLSHRFAAYLSRIALPIDEGETPPRRESILEASLK
jgi:hypothetical protein